MCQLVGYLINKRQLLQILLLVYFNNFFETMYATEEKSVMLTWYSNGASLREVSALFSVQYPDRYISSLSTIRSVVKRLKSTSCKNSSHEKRSRILNVSTEALKIN